jgi:hypothetical protein
MTTDFARKIAAKREAGSSPKPMSMFWLALIRFASLSK